MEKRLPIAIVVYLAQARNQSIKEPEVAYTDNLSTHGACVISSRTWELGEVVEVASLKDRTALRGKVVHCEKRSDDRYAVGLSFNGYQVTWSRYRSYSAT
jgi:hypothetical protein